MALPLCHIATAYRCLMSADPKRDPDERVKLPEDAQTTLRALLAVDPDDQGADENDGDTRNARDTRKEAP